MIVLDLLLALQITNCSQKKSNICDFQPSGAKMAGLQCILKKTKTKTKKWLHEQVEGSLSRIFEAMAHFKDGDSVFLPHLH